MSALLLLTSMALAGLPAADSQGQALPTLAPMLEQATPAVVNISTQARIRVQDNPLLSDPFFRWFFRVPEQQSSPRQQPQSLGSGVIIDAAKGYVITNHHVIDKAAAITVTLSDGRSLQAELVGSDPETDVAVIKIPAEALTAMPLADSEQLRVGDFVVAIGNPFGLGQTVTSGIVSALGRSGLGIEGYEDFIQTDASINPGNSGGALVDLNGHLVGMNTAILAPGGGNVGIGFAIPTNMAQKVINQLIEYGEVRRGRLGISVQGLSADLARAFDITTRSGVVVTQVVSGSPAERAGLEVGDVITHIDGRNVNGVADLRNILGLIRVDEKLKLRLLRGGREKNITAVIAASQQRRLDGASLSPQLAGAVFSLAEVQQVSGRTIIADNIIVVVNVELGSPAWHANLREGDVITSINKHSLANFDDMRTAVASSQRGILMNIQRGNTALFILIQ